MIINPSLPGGHTVFCDDIRRELNGKMTLVGSYNGAMFINGALPTTLPKFCLAVSLWEEQGSLEPVSVKVFFPGDEPDAPSASAEMNPQADMPQAANDEFTMRESMFFFEIPGAVIREEGFIKVRAYRGDNEIWLGALPVLLNPNSAGGNASKPAEAGNH